MEFVFIVNTGCWGDEECSCGDSLNSIWTNQKDAEDHVLALTEKRKNPDGCWRDLWDYINVVKIKVNQSNLYESSEQLCYFRFNFETNDIEEDNPWRAR
jgi:hypothetical protein